MALALALTLPGVVPVAAHTPEDPKPFNLVAGQNYLIGTVSVGNDADYIYVTYEVIGGWELLETHLAAALSLGTTYPSDGLPQTKKGDPILGKFPWKANHNPAVTTYTYQISLADEGFYVGQYLYIAAHAVVALDDWEETAWADGSCGNFLAQFPGKSWATYFEYVIQ